MIVVPTEGRLWLADRLWRLDWPDSDGFRLHLYSSNYTPVLASEAADFTECAFTGYSQVSIPKGDNPAPILVANQAQVLLGNTSHEWTATGALETIYGWYLTDESNSVCVLAEKYVTPHVLANGSVHTLFPYVNLGKLIAD